LKAIEEDHEKLQKSYEELGEEKKMLNEKFKKIVEENVEKEKSIEELQEQIQVLSEEKETKTKELVEKLKELKKTKEKEIEEKINEVRKESDEKVARLEEQVKNITKKNVELEKRISEKTFLIEGNNGYIRQIEELEKYLEEVNCYNIGLKERIDELIQDKVDEEKYSTNGNIHLKESFSSSDLASSTLLEELGGKIYSSPSSSPTKESPTGHNSRGKSFSFSQRNRSASVISIATVGSFDSSYDSLNSS
jgi:chromosome segregation ATPase